MKQRSISLVVMLVITLVVAVLWFAAPDRRGFDSPQTSGSPARDPKVGLHTAPARDGAEAVGLTQEQGFPPGSGPTREEVESQIRLAMEQVRSRGPVIGGLVDMLNAHATVALQILSPYLEDDSPRVRERAQALLAAVARTAPREVRRDVVEVLIAALDDPASTVSQHAAKFLGEFSSEDLSDSAIQELQKRLEAEDVDPSLIRLAGIAGLESQRGRLEQLYLDGPSDPSMQEGIRYYTTPEWAGALALARLGDEEVTGHVVSRISNETNTVVRVGRLLEDAAFTRQPAAFELIREHLDSEDLMPSVKVGRPGIPVAQHALPILAESLSDFPLEGRNPGLYTDEQIELARDWMADKQNWLGQLESP